MADLDRRLSVVALQQLCLITLADVRAAGGTRDHAHERVLSGRWEQVFDGVFRLAGVPWTYEARVLALVLAAGPGAVASHRCAMRLRGLGFPTAPPEISIPRGRNFRPTGQRVHTSTDLQRCSIEIVQGVPTTDSARTMLDVARFIRGQALVSAVEAARRQGLTWRTLLECLARHARRGRHGVRRLREVISAGMANDAVTDTDSELMALALLREHGFDEPALQHRVYDVDGELVAEMDFAYLDLMANLEIDGPVHLRPEVQRKDHARDSRLRGMGWTVRRIMREIPMQQPNEFIRIVRDTLRQAHERLILVSPRREDPDGMTQERVG